MACPPREHFDLFFGITRSCGMAANDIRDRGLQPKNLEETAHGSLDICDEGVSFPPLLAGRLGTFLGEPFQIDTAYNVEMHDAFQGEIRALDREHGRLSYADGTVAIETNFRIELDDDKSEVPSERSCAVCGVNDDPAASITQTKVRDIDHVNSQDCACPWASTANSKQAGVRHPMSKSTCICVSQCLTSVTTCIASIASLLVLGEG